MCVCVCVCVQYSMVHTVPLIYCSITKHGIIGMGQVPCHRLHTFASVSSVMIKSHSHTLAPLPPSLHPSLPPSFPPSLPLSSRPPVFTHHGAGGSTLIRSSGRYRAKSTSGHNPRNSTVSRSGRRVSRVRKESAVSTARPNWAMFNRSVSVCVSSNHIC